MKGPKMTGREDSGEEEWRRNSVIEGFGTTAGLSDDGEGRVTEMFDD